MASKISLAQVMKMKVGVDDCASFSSLNSAIFPLQQLSTHYISGSPIPSLVFIIIPRPVCLSSCPSSLCFLPFSFYLSPHQAPLFLKLRVSERVGLFGLTEKKERKEGLESRTTRNPRWNLNYPLKKLPLHPAF